VPVRYTSREGRTYEGFAAYVRLIFTTSGLFIAAYILVGVFHNTAAPHLPAFAFSTRALHSWVQYVISVLFWPLSFWHPTFSVSHWPAGSTP
jgi:hypothetical protein